jgi:excisionase family DNA binding protein
VTASTRLNDKWFLTVSECAGVLEVDPRTVRRAIDRGEIPAVRVGTNLRVPMAWLRERAHRDGEQHPFPVHNEKQE